MRRREHAVTIRMPFGIDLPEDYDDERWPAGEGSLVDARHATGDQGHGLSLSVCAGFGEDAFKMRADGSGSNAAPICHIVKRNAAGKVTRDHGLRPREAEEFTQGRRAECGGFRITHDDKSQGLCLHPKA